MGFPIHTEALQLPHLGIAERALLTALQQRIFDLGMLTSAVIDKALEQLDDWALHVKVNHYCSNMDILESKHKTMAQLCVEIQVIMEDIHSSIY